MHNYIAESRLNWAIYQRLALQNSLYQFLHDEPSAVVGGYQT